MRHVTPQTASNPDNENPASEAPNSASNSNNQNQNNEKRKLDQHDCDQCQRSFSTKSNLNKHLKMNTCQRIQKKKLKSTATTLPQPTRSTNLPSSTFIPTSSKSTSPQPSISKVVHPPTSTAKLSIAPKPKPHKPFYCPTCGKSFTRGDNLQKHQKTQYRKRGGEFEGGSVSATPPS